MGGWDKAPEYGGEMRWYHIAGGVVFFVVLTLGFVACTQQTQTKTDEVTYVIEAEPPLGPGSVISGPATITDGDTIRIGETRIRFDGIDSPERGKTCGSVNVYDASSDALRRLIGVQSVSCTITDEPDGNRQIAQCSVGGTDLNEYMVSQGWARDWPRYSNGAYADEETSARGSSRGLWALQCPADLWGGRDYSR